MPALEISIPTTSTSSTPSPHTIYNLTLRLPLRTFTLQKRYSDFVTLHALLASQAGGQAPPAPLPSKSVFSSTLKSPALTEKRRAGLEAYLRAANDAPDPRWRETSAWRGFLNLPAGSSTSSLKGYNNGVGEGRRGGGMAGVGVVGVISDPVAWLDTHRELRTHLHSARAHIANRDASSSTLGSLASSASVVSVATMTTGTTSGSGVSDIHAETAAAKKELVKAGALLGALDKGLRENGKEWSSKRLGEGEVRRRKDLLAAARREVDGLEGLLTLVRHKNEADEAVANHSGATTTTSDDKTSLLHQNNNKNNNAISRGRRVLGKESARTRELDNRGVAQLQQEMMREQDADVEALASAVRRQRELGEQINEELVVQNEMLGLLGEDVDRVEGKVRVARKKIDRIH